MLQMESGAQNAKVLVGTLNEIRSAANAIPNFALCFKTFATIEAIFVINSWFAFFILITSPIDEFEIMSYVKSK